MPRVNPTAMKMVNCVSCPERHWGEYDGQPCPTCVRRLDYTTHPQGQMDRIDPQRESRVAKYAYRAGQGLSLFE